jgi:hypothetical protein
MLRRGDSDLAALLVAQQVEDDLEAAEAVGDYLERRAALRVDDCFIGWFHDFYRRQVFNACLQDALREIDPTVAPETKAINAIAIGAGRPDDRWAEAALRLCSMTEPEFNVWIAEQWQHVRDNCDLECADTSHGFTATSGQELKPNAD